MSKSTKNYRDFIRQFGQVKFPFKSLIESDRQFRNDLYTEFIQTEQKPDSYLYTAQYLTDKEINNGFAEANKKTAVSSSQKVVAAQFIPTIDIEKRLYDIEAEFHQKLKEGLLSNSFYSHDLSQTHNVKTLIEIGENFDLLQKLVLSDFHTEQYDNRPDAKSIAGDICTLLARLKSRNLTNNIRNTILEDRENRHLAIESILGNQSPIVIENYKTKYAILKTHFNKHLSKCSPPPSPAIPASTTPYLVTQSVNYKMQPQEPTYDTERLRTDLAYRYAMVDTFTEYMNSLDEDADRTVYYIDMCHAMGYPLYNPLILCGFIIPERQFVEGSNGDTFFDEEGNEVPYKHWHLPVYKTTEEKANRNKLYFFHCFLKQKFIIPLNRPFLKHRPDFDELKADYLSKERTERSRAVHLSWVRDEIQVNQTLGIMDMKKNPIMPNVKEQIEKATILIERELEGIHAIKWGEFYRSRQMETFAMLWGLVEFKRFLEQEPTHTIPPLQPAPVSDKPDKPLRDTLEKCFEHSSKYATVMGLLVKKQWCQPGTFLWIDESVGAKGTLIALIKHLHAQGFYHNNTKPSNAQIVSIAKNTFGLDVSIDLVKKTKLQTGHTNNLAFIQPASTY